MTAATEGFSADWLALREPFDHAAREAAMPVLAGGGPAVGGADGASLSVLDLGCGTGSNLRFLAPRLGVARQHWTVIDHDPALLAGWPARPPGPPGVALQVTPQRLDLAGGFDRLALPPGGLVTGSALLDLVSRPWLQRLVDASARAGTAWWFALSVDGRLSWTPSDPDDAPVLAAFEAHQRRDKGFGPALGPDAPREAARSLRAAGYRVIGARSDWLIDGRAGPDGPGAALPMLQSLIEGMARAAAEQQPALAPAVAGWRARRLARVVETVLRVGHVDLRAWPPGAAAGRAADTEGAGD